MSARPPARAPNPAPPPGAGGARGEESPPRNDGVTMGRAGCAACGRPVPAGGRRRYCSAACRQAAWRRRHPVRLPPVPARLPRPATVYECPACGRRLLGEQRCADCGLFCRRIGPGGACPHCDEPVAVADLLPTPPATPPAC
jgi:hypothetical protein